MKEKCYNPLKILRFEENFEEKCYQMLQMMIAECSTAFEQLPCLVDVEILRNILYAGVWTKYRKKQMEKEEKKSG